VLFTTGCHGYQFERERETLLCDCALRPKKQLYFRQCDVRTEAEETVALRAYYNNVTQPDGSTPTDGNKVSFALIVKKL
jgi:hypothetical protein